MRKTRPGFAILVAMAALFALTEQAAGVWLEFDLTLEEMNLTSGPFLMPLASDPLNSLPDSVDGYGFVESTATLTLSSQRPVNPGPATTGKLFAYSVGENPPSGNDPPPINPDELDGSGFAVYSFLDIFFDLTLTDVDSRPGRDFAGQPDGASISVIDVGDRVTGVLKIQNFDKDAPNFGMFPPRDGWDSTFTSPFLLELPLGDINGNGEFDAIELFFGHFSPVEESIQFPEWPDVPWPIVSDYGTIAVLYGKVGDSLTDPPFTIGSLLPGGLPDPNAFGGPTTATSTLRNPVIPEPSSLAIWSLIGLAGIGVGCWRRKRNR